jgi:LCP family protein required for cell wall assembly
MPRTNFRPIFIRYIAVWGIALILALALFNFVRNLTICWRITPIPGIPPSSCTLEKVTALETPIIGQDPVAVEPTATSEPNPFENMEYPTWDGGSRINILFVGFRGGDPHEEDCPFCTDTLMLMTVDPITKTAGILSIPRDLWVNIPGFGYSRINTAWTLGRGSKLPGGGPALAMKTVSHVIGVPVNYYVQVDFDTFIDIIDLLGGVDIYNDETLILDPVSHGKDYPKVKLTCCGIRHLKGRVALAYVRCRHAEKGCKDGDIGRARRQQKVIFAIRDKVLDPANFPTLMALAPPLYDKFSEGIHTNLSLEAGLRLAVLVKDIPKENIKNKVIDNHMVVADSVILGGQNASILRPLPDQIRLVRDEVFTSSGPVSPLAEEDLFTLTQADGARIRILNGTSTAELDRRTGEYLSRQGLQITELGKAKSLSRTTIILYSPKLYALKYLLDVFGIDHSTQILMRSDPSQTVDIEIRLGQDWASKLPPDFPD